MRAVIPNDMGEILKAAEIRAIYCNGQTAYGIYTASCEPLTGIKAVLLPSTSTANAAWSTERLTEAWRIILRE